MCVCVCTCTTVYENQFEFKTSGMRTVLESEENFARSPQTGYLRVRLDFESEVRIKIRFGFASLRGGISHKYVTGNVGVVECLM